MPVAVGTCGVIPVKATELDTSDFNCRSYYLLKNPKRITNKTPYVTLIRKCFCVFGGFLSN